MLIVENIAVSSFKFKIMESHHSISKRVKKRNEKIYYTVYFMVPPIFTRAN